MNAPMWLLVFGGFMAVLGVLFVVTRGPVSRWNARAAMRMQADPNKNESLGNAEDYARYNAVFGVLAILVGVVCIVVGLGSL